jgi:hypothetical protein
VILEEAKSKSQLPAGPDVPAIRELLLRCLELHYGSLDRCVVVPGKAEDLLRRIHALLDEAGY